MKHWQTQYGPWALITGASAGLGAEFARQLAARGLHIALVARRKDRLDALAEQLQTSHGIQTRTIAEDLTADGACARVASAVSDLDIGLLINNAGFGLSGYYHALDPERQAQMAVLNCVVPVLLTSHFLPPMRARKRGGIIFLASTAAYQACPTFAVYGATKAFNLMLGEALAREYKQSGVDVLSLSPGFTHTEFSDVARIKAAGALRQATSEAVVAHGLTALGKKSSTVHGWLNKISAFATRLLPRRTVINLAYHALKNRIQSP